MLNSKVDTEVKSILGRADVVIKTKTDIFVLELKVDDSVENALAQIDSKSYAIPYESDGRKVTKCGIRIASEQRNMTQWRIIDENGNIIVVGNLAPKLSDASIKCGSLAASLSEASTKYGKLAANL